MSSFSSTSRTITFTKKNGNFSSYITCDQGDIYVDYKDATSLDPTNYIPQFSPTNFRTLELNIHNSILADNEFTVDSVKWTANTDNVTGLPYYYEVIDSGMTLKIKGPIAIKSNNQTIIITAEATVRCNETDISVVTAHYKIPVRQGGDNIWHVMIAACDEKSNYTINNGDYIDVKCLVYDPTGTLQPAGGYQYKWYKWHNAAWEDVTTNTGVETLRIERDDVDNQAMYMVEVYGPNAEGNGFSTEMLGFDTQMIYDALDEYNIIVIPSQEEKIEQGSGDQIDYRIQIYNRDQQANARKATVSFYLHAYGIVPVNSAVGLEWDASHSGTDPNGNVYGPSCTMFSVTEQNFIDNGGTELTLDISAEITEG